MDVMAEAFGRKLVARTEHNIHVSNPIPSQRTFALDSCLADDERRFFFLKSRFLSLKILENAAEPILVAAFVDKNGLANALRCSGGITTFQEMLQCSYFLFQRIQLCFRQLPW